MRETIAGVWLYGIIFAFILMFAGYLAVSVKYSEAFKIKNDMLWIIESHNGLGVNNGKIASTFHHGVELRGHFGGLNGINVYLLGAHYDAKGYCPNDTGWRGVKSLDTEKDTSEPVKKSSRYYWCFRKNKINGSSYYSIRIFFKFNLPVIGDIVTFHIDGTTIPIAITKDSY